MRLSRQRGAGERLKRSAEALLPPALMRKLRVAKFQRERQRFAQRVVSHVYGGHRLQVAIGSPYGMRYDMDWDELGEIAFLKRHRLRPGARVLNLGANHGVVALMLAREVGADGLVVALEAHPHDAAIAERNGELNEARQLLCLHGAVAQRSGTVTFGLNGEVDDGSRRWGDLEVPAWSIDDLARRYGAPDVVFMDVEGYEHEALLGAEETLSRAPDWFVEVHADDQLSRYGGSAEALLGRFERDRYELYVAEDGLRFTPARAISLTSFQRLEDAPPVLLEGRFFFIALGHEAQLPRSALDEGR